jgi:hypothetical protein
MNNELILFTLLLDNFQLYNFQLYNFHLLGDCFKDSEFQEHFQY